jgi:hypothetical protein
MKAGRVRDDGIIDEIAIERAMSGDMVWLTMPERLEAVRLMTERGWPASRIAERMHATKRSVVRWRAMLAAPAAEAGRELVLSGAPRWKVFPSDLI